MSNLITNTIPYPLFIARAARTFIPQSPTGSIDTDVDTSESEPTMIINILSN